MWLEINVVNGALRYQIKNSVVVVWETYLPCSNEFKQRWYIKRKDKPMKLTGDKARGKARYFKVDAEIIEAIL